MTRGVKFYDVIIVGAGPAGLSAAWYLTNRNLHVLLIEQKKLFVSEKSWLTSYDIIKKYDLQPAVAHFCDEGILKLYSGAEVHIKKKRIINVFDEKKLLKLLFSRCNKNKLIVLPNTTFYKYYRKDGLITISTSKGNFQGKILILATGGDFTKDSTLKGKKIAYYTTYARIYKNCTPLMPPNIAILLHKGYPHPIAGQWTNPICKNSYLFGEINFTTHGDITECNSRKDKAELKDRLEYYVNNIQNFAKINKKFSYQEYYGIVPMMKNYKVVEDNIIRIGDAGMQAKPFYGLCIDQIFRQLPFLTKTVVQAIKKKDYSENSLKLFNAQKNTTFHLNYEFGIIILKLLETAPQHFIDEIARAIEKMSNKVKYNLLFGCLTPKQFISIIKNIEKSIGMKKILEYIPRKDYLFLVKESGLIFKEILKSENEA